MKVTAQNSDVSLHPMTPAGGGIVWEAAAILIGFVLVLFRRATKQNMKKTKGNAISLRQ